MEISVTFRHMEPTEALKDYARQRLERIRKYIRRPIDCHIVFSVERHHHVADVTLRVKGLSIRGEERTQDMYSSIDAVVDKLERQIRKYKDKLRDHRTWDRPPADEQWVDMAVVESIVGQTEAEGSARARITHTERIPAEAMLLDDAVMRMDLSRAPVTVFTNLADDRICVLYRRDDGTYGLIEAAGPQERLRHGGAGGERDEAHRADLP